MTAKPPYGKEEGAAPAAAAAQSPGHPGQEAGAAAAPAANGAADAAGNGHAPGEGDTRGNGHAGNGGGRAARTPAEVEQMQKRIAELESRVQESQDQTRHYAAAYDKARSEFTAVRERMAREHERNLRRDQAKAVSGLLNVLDSLDRSLESVRAASPGQPFVDGVHLIRSQFEAALGQLGLARFDGVGEVFDPARHQAVTTIPVTDPNQDGRVVQGLAAGATVGDEVVRPATVVVGKFTRSDRSDDAAENWDDDDGKMN